MDREFEFVETMFKSILLLVTLPLWFPALLAMKLFEKLYD